MWLLIEHNFVKELKVVYIFVTCKTRRRVSSGFVVLVLSKAILFSIFCFLTISVESRS